MSLGCEQAMRDQPRYDTFQASDFFDDGTSARPIIPETVPRGALQTDEPFYTGLADGELVEELPVPLTAELLERGRERFEIFCSVCHGYSGYGNGMVVERGFRRPPSYHIDRLRGAPVGHFFRVMTGGFGAMPSYASQVPPADRWAIAAYIRALQLSQHATLDDVPPDVRQRLQEEPSAP